MIKSADKVGRLLSHYKNRPTFMSHNRWHYRPINCCKDPTTNNKCVSQSQRRISADKFYRPRKIGRQKLSADFYRTTKIGRFLMSHERFLSADVVSRQNRPIFIVRLTAALLTAALCISSSKCHITM